jgi:glycosyltransferase involved in cell wall biosynthesis
MKILYVQKIKGIGGSERYFLEIIPSLISRNISIELLCICEKKDHANVKHYFQLLEKKKIKYHVLIYSTISSPILLKKINIVVTKGAFDLVHTHLIHADFWLALIKIFYNRSLTIVSTLHGFDEKYMNKHGLNPAFISKSLYCRLNKFSSKYIHKYFAVSHGLKKLFTTSELIPENKIEVIHHGINEKSNDKLNTSFHYSKFQLIIPNRIVPLKGQHLVIEALEKVIEFNPEIILLIIGERQGSYFKKLEALVNDKKLINHVKFLGFKSNILDYISSSDVVIIPSKAEGFGLTFLEAMKCKKPIIAFDVPAGNEIIIHEETGLLIKPFDVEKLSSAIIELMSDKEKCHTLGNNGYQRFVNEFSKEKMITNTANFYLGVLN